jgi:hypothetical protein
VLSIKIKEIPTMASPKKSKPANDSAPSPLLNTTWESFFGLANDARAELHKQVGALITFADGALQGATSYAVNVNDHTDRVAREALFAADRAGRTLAAAGRDASRKLVASYRDGTAQIVATTRDSARNVAERASATARVIVAPSKRAKAA